ncbi:hypothetical protein ACOME3_000862 [Neoechinorhynchus agilis]
MWMDDGSGRSGERIRPEWMTDQEFGVDDGSGMWMTDPAEVENGSGIRVDDGSGMWMDEIRVDDGSGRSGERIRPEWMTDQEFGVDDGSGMWMTDPAEVENGSGILSG